jgi:hypothetical protein
MTAGLFSRVVWETVEIQNAMLRVLLKNKITQMLFRLAGRSGFIDPFCLWSGPAAKALKGRRYDVVIATIPPSSAATIAARHARLCGALSYVDYRDPWHNLNYYGRKTALAEYFLKINAAVEKRCIDGCAKVITVSPTLGRWAEEKTATPVHVLPHGFVPNPKTEVYDGDLGLPLQDEDGSKIVFYYVGALLYDRDLSPVFELALGMRDQAGVDCRVLYSGNQGDLARRQAESVGAADCLVSTGQISHQQVNGLMAQVTANVVVISSGYEYQYPGKLWDAIAARRPVLLVGAADSDAAQLVKEHDLGIVMTPGAPLDTRQMLDRLRQSQSSSDRNLALSKLSTDRLYDDFVDDVTGDVKDSKQLQKSVRQ